ncbi:MAG: hydrolase, TatD family [Acidimicrobiaceae bacterium]|nr:hydrolase, TatD family [Acidimicrobiaceae bacterium]
MSTGPAAVQEAPDGAPWTDSHCHLQDFDDVASILERAIERRVGRVVCVGTDLDTSRRAVEIASTGPGTRGASPQLWATVGLHPHAAKNGLEPLKALLGDVVPKPGRPRGTPGDVVGVGECGLDYHYDHSPRHVQREVFAAQVALARELDLALVVHTREAWDDTFAVLAAEGMPERTIIHCFTGGPGEARRCLDAGAYLSFSGIVTFKGAPEVREAAAICPLGRMLIETDSPFLAPVPHRGSANEPAYVTLVGVAVAEAKGITPAEIAVATSANAAAAFGLVPLDSPG